MEYNPAEPTDEDVIVDIPSVSHTVEQKKSKKHVQKADLAYIPLPPLPDAPPLPTSKKSLKQTISLTSIGSKDARGSAKPIKFSLAHSMKVESSENVVSSKVTSLHRRSKATVLPTGVILNSRDKSIPTKSEALDSNGMTETSQTPSNTTGSSHNRPSSSRTELFLPTQSDLQELLTAPQSTFPTGFRNGLPFSASLVNSNHNVPRMLGSILGASSLFANRAGMVPGRAVNHMGYPAVSSLPIHPSTFNLQHLTAQRLAPPSALSQATPEKSIDSFRVDSSVVKTTKVEPESPEKHSIPPKRKRHSSPSPSTPEQRRSRSRSHYKGRNKKSSQEKETNENKKRDRYEGSKRETSITSQKRSESRNKKLYDSGSTKKLSSSKRDSRSKEEGMRVKDNSKSVYHREERPNEPRERARTSRSIDVKASRAKVKREPIVESLKEPIDSASHKEKKDDNVKKRESVNDSTNKAIVPSKQISSEKPVQHGRSRHESIDKKRKDSVEENITKLRKDGNYESRNEELPHLSSTSVRKSSSDKTEKARKYRKRHSSSESSITSSHKIKMIKAEHRDRFSSHSSSQSKVSVKKPVIVKSKSPHHRPVKISSRHISRPSPKTRDRHKEKSKHSKEPSKLRVSPIREKKDLHNDRDAILKEKKSYQRLSPASIESPKRKYLKHSAARSPSRPKPRQRRRRSFESRDRRYSKSPSLRASKEPKRNTTASKDHQSQKSELLRREFQKKKYSESRSSSSTSSSSSSSSEIQLVHKSSTRKTRTPVRKVSIHTSQRKESSSTSPIRRNDHRHSYPEPHQKEFRTDQRMHLSRYSAGRDKKTRQSLKHISPHKNSNIRRDSSSTEDSDRRSQSLKKQQKFYHSMHHHLGNHRRRSRSPSIHNKKEASRREWLVKGYPHDKKSHQEPIRYKVSSKERKYGITRHSNSPKKEVKRHVSRHSSSSSSDTTSSSSSSSDSRSSSSVESVRRKSLSPPQQRIPLETSSSSRHALHDIPLPSKTSKGPIVVKSTKCEKSDEPKVASSKNEKSRRKTDSSSSRSSDDEDCRALSAHNVYDRFLKKNDKIASSLRKHGNLKSGVVNVSVKPVVVPETGSKVAPGSLTSTSLVVNVPPLDSVNLEMQLPMSAGLVAPISNVIQSNLLPVASINLELTTAVNPTLLERPPPPPPPPAEWTNELEVPQWMRIDNFPQHGDASSLESVEMEDVSDDEEMVSIEASEDEEMEMNIVDDREDGDDRDDVSVRDPMVIESDVNSNVGSKDDDDDIDVDKDVNVDADEEVNVDVEEEEEEETVKNDIPIGHTSASVAHSSPEKYHDTSGSALSTSADVTLPMTQDIPEPPLPQYEHIIENKWTSSALRISRQLRRGGRKIESSKWVCDCTIPNPDEVAAGQRACGGMDCINRALNIECGTMCPTGTMCTNKLFQKRQYGPIKPFYAGPEKCWGLKSTDAIYEGDFIIEYVGEVVDFREFQRRVKNYDRIGQAHHYFMSLGRDIFIDAGEQGNWARFANHSCEPNAETAKWNVNGQIRIGFFAKETIPANSEITIDYQFVQFGQREQKCYCGAPSCKGIMGAFSKQFQDKVRTKDTRGTQRRIKRLLALTKLSSRAEVQQLLQVMVQEFLPRDVRYHLCQLLIKDSSEVCLKLFLQYNGLEMVAAYMCDAARHDWDMKKLLLQCLECLPVSEKQQLCNGSNVYGIVQQWCIDPRFSRPTNNASQGTASQKDDQYGSGSGSLSKTNSTSSELGPTSNDGEDSESVNSSTRRTTGSGSVNQDEEDAGEAEVDRETGETHEFPPDPEKQAEVRAFAQKLIEKWSSLPERIYRIPKMERHATEEALQKGTNLRPAYVRSVLPEQAAPTLSWGQQNTANNNNKREVAEKPQKSNITKEDFRRWLEMVARLHGESLKLPGEEATKELVKSPHKSPIKPVETVALLVNEPCPVVATAESEVVTPSTMSTSQPSKVDEFDNLELSNLDLNSPLAIEKIRLLISRMLIRCIEQIRHSGDSQDTQNFTPELMEFLQGQSSESLAEQLKELQQADSNHLAQCLVSSNSNQDSNSQSSTPSNAALFPINISPQLPPGWCCVRDIHSGRLYYYHSVTQVTQWEIPVYPWDAGEDYEEAYNFGNASQHPVTHEEIAQMYVMLNEKFKQRVARERVKKVSQQPIMPSKDKQTFNKKLYAAVYNYLRKFREEAQKSGKAFFKDDFRRFAKKLTSIVEVKERKMAPSGCTLRLTNTVHRRVCKFIEEYMKKKFIHSSTKHHTPRTPSSEEI